jgi:hypothetical protein
MLVALSAFVPRVLMIVTVVIAIVVTLMVTTRACDDASGRECNQSQ